MTSPQGNRLPASQRYMMGPSNFGRPEQCEGCVGLDCDDCVPTMLVDGLPAMLASDELAVVARVVQAANTQPIVGHNPFS